MRTFQAKLLSGRVVTFHTVGLADHDKVYRLSFRLTEIWDPLLRGLGDADGRDLIQRAARTMSEAWSSMVAEIQEALQLCSDLTPAEIDDLEPYEVIYLILPALGSVLNLGKLLGAVQALLIPVVSLPEGLTKTSTPETLPAKKGKAKGHR